MSDPYPHDAAQEWVEVSGALIHGIVHTLNNRIASLEGLGATLEPREDIAKLEARLAGEGERLRQVKEMLRLVSVEPGAGPEASTLVDLVESATLLAHLHPDMHDVTARCEFRGAELMPAVRVHQRQMVHALVLAMLATAAGGAGDIMALCTRADDDRVQILLRPLRPAVADDAVPRSRCAAANALLQVEGGTVELQARAGSRAVVVSLPSLASVRRTERSGSP